MSWRAKNLGSIFFSFIDKSFLSPWYLCFCKVWTLFCFIPACCIPGQTQFTDKRNVTIVILFSSFYYQINTKKSFPTTVVVVSFMSVAVIIFISRNKFPHRNRWGHVTFFSVTHKIFSFREGLLHILNWHKSEYKCDGILDWVSGWDKRSLLSAGSG